MFAVVPLLLALIATTEVATADALLRNARLLDGTGAAPREHVAILIRGGRIAAIGESLAVPDVPVLDVGGATVLPGLIDAHVHFTAAPGSRFRGDTDETTATLNQAHLRAYLACGVTTVLDAGSFEPLLRALRSWLAAGHPGPRVLTTGPYMRHAGDMATSASAR